MRWHIVQVDIDSKYISIVSKTTTLIFIVVQSGRLDKSQKFQVQSFLPYKEGSTPPNFKHHPSIPPVPLTVSKGWAETARLQPRKIFFWRSSLGKSCHYADSPIYQVLSTLKHVVLEEGVTNAGFYLHHRYIKPPKPFSIGNQHASLTTTTI